MAELKRALEREEFELHYRPIISLADKRVSGFEVELHWRHPKRGLLDPAQFMAVAEDKGLGGSLAKYALAMACVQLYQWQSFFPLARSLFASVAIRDAKLLGPELLASVKAILSAASLTAGTLRLETRRAHASRATPHKRPTFWGSSSAAAPASCSTQTPHPPLS